MLTKENGEEEEIVVPPTNPLTGAGVEDGFDADALNRRIASFVVENAPDARRGRMQKQPGCRIPTAFLLKNRHVHGSIK